MVFDVNKKTSSRTTGYSYLVRDLATQLVLNPGVSVDCYSKNKEPELSSWQGVKLLHRPLRMIFRYARPYYFIRGLKAAYYQKGTLWESLNTVFGFLEGGLVEHYIKQNKYDLVCIQGVTELSLPYILACNRMKVPYNVSFHSFNCFQETMGDNEDPLMKWAVNELAKKGVPTSYISTGMLNRALNVVDHRFRSQAQFYCIPNGSKSIPGQNNSARCELGIPENATVCLCCGNISVLKNQIQVVRSFNYLAKSLQERFFIMLVGNNNDERLAEAIEACNYPDHIKLCGSVAHEQLAKYFNAATFVCVSSLSEGFGLSAVESFMFGKPVLMWSDLDAVKDLYSGSAMILVDERSDQQLAKGIERLLSCKWDSKAIKTHAQQFTFDKMVESYYRWYKNQIAAHSRKDLS
ncbi:MAG: glycosyltransferase family 4 protein [Eggerthellaceae bacterium]